MAPAPTPMTTLLLIRHGESEANVREDTHIAGRSPASALTPKGERQAAAVGPMLRARYGPSLSRVTAVYASPAVRAAGTAAAALAAAGAGAADHPVTLAEELLEIYQGDWEEAPRAEVLTPEVRAAAERDPGHHHAPGGESPAEVEERAARFLFGRVIPDTVASVAAAAAAAAASVNGGDAESNGAAEPAARADGLGGVVLVFTHGFVIKTLVRRVTGGGWDSVLRTHVSNGGAVEVGVTADGALILLRCNDDAHVRGVV